jgi:hypothetical protein
MKKWPETLNELYNETINIYTDLKNQESTNNSEVVDETILIRPIGYLIRLVHVTESIGTQDIVNSTKNMLDEYLNIIRNRNLTHMIKQRLLIDIASYKKWINELSLMIRIDAMEELVDILTTRDYIHGEMEILKRLNENIDSYVKELDVVDTKFKEIGINIQYDMLNEISIKIFPKVIYWWWYIGDKKK